MLNFSSIRNALSCSCMALLLGGCISGNLPPPRGTTTQVPIEERSNPSVASIPQNNSQEPGGAVPATINPGKNQVTIALLEKSATAHSAGNHQQAITYVERAIRINPRRADLWVQLAQLQLAIEQPSAAQDYARKAITLAGTRMDWVRDAWLVIAQAKEAQGLAQEASAIRRRWETARG